MAEGQAAPPASATLWPVLALLCNALVWGLSWWPLRQLQALGVHPLWATAAVYTLALALLLAWLRPRWRLLAAHRSLWLLALAAGLTNIGFNWSVTVGDVVRAVLLFYLMPAWAVPLSWWLLGERPGVGALARLGLALAGVLLVLHQPGTPWPWPRTLADGLALGAGALFALTNVLLRKLADTPATSRALAMFGGGALTALGGALAASGFGLLPWPVGSVGDWRAALGVGAALALVLLGANLALQYGAARLPVRVTTLVMLSEVVFAALSSIWLGAAQPAAQTWLGGTLVLAAALLAAQADARRLSPSRADRAGV